MPRPKAIKVGDVVTLKSDGAKKMTVSAIQEFENRPTVVDVWFFDGDGSLRSFNVPMSVLSISSD